jgi:hypothetical protein
VGALSFSLLRSYGFFGAGYCCAEGVLSLPELLSVLSLRLFLPSFLAGDAPAALVRAAPALHYKSDAGCARIVISAFSGSAVEFPLFSLLRGCTTIRSDVVVPDASPDFQL